ncbi:MAG TPA: peptidase, partial [Planctomycetaceae bacterium]
TPEAAASGKLVEIIGSLNDPNQPNVKIEGSVQQPIVLVRGQNQVPFWTENTTKLPIAVTDEAPFEITIVEPKVPLVRGGQMELKVVAKRKDGFKAPIKIDMLWLPPGIGASGSVAIAEGQTEAAIPMNAAGNAELATWKIAIRGEANGGNGNVMVSTPFANLRIAEMYMTLAFEQAAVEQGKETELLVHMTKQFDFPGTARVNLIGLPNKAVTTTQDATIETKDIIFKIATDMTTPAGNHANLFCQIIVTENGEPVIHNIGTGKLRVDVPLPPKKDALPAPPPMPTAAPAAEKPPEPKRLSRLEQLRLEQQEREKAKKAPAAPPATPPADPK